MKCSSVFVTSAFVFLATTQLSFACLSEKLFDNGSSCEGRAGGAGKHNPTSSVSFLDKAFKEIEKGTRNVGRAMKKGAKDAGRTLNKAVTDVGKTGEKAVHDVGKATEKATHDAGNAISETGQELGDFGRNINREFNVMMGNFSRELGYFECTVLEGRSPEPRGEHDDRDNDGRSDKFTKDCLDDKKIGVGVSGNSDGSDGFYFDYDGQRLHFKPNEWEKTERSQEERKRESLASFQQFNEFLASVSPDPSKAQLSVVDGIDFEDIWIKGIKSALSAFDPIGPSMESFLAPNKTGLIRFNDGYAKTGGSFLSLRSNKVKGKYFHSGIDYQMVPGEPVYAGVSGKVIRVNGCAYCGDYKSVGTRPTDVKTRYYKTVWIRTKNNFVVRYLYVSSDVQKNAVVQKGELLGTAQDLELRYKPLPNRGPMTNHVHVQITDPEGRWISPDSSFQTSKDKKKIKKAGDYYAEELLRIQGMLNHLNKPKN